MMKFLLVPVLLLLAACGNAGNGNKGFAVEVDRPAIEVAADLAALEADDLAAIIPSQTQVIKTQADAYSLDFRFVAPTASSKAKPQETNIHFRLEQLEGNRTRIRVNLDVPSIVLYGPGKDKMLSASKLGGQLKLALDSYASLVKQGREATAAVGKIDFLFSALALAMDRSAMENLAAADSSGADFGQFADDDVAYSPPERDDYSSEYSSDPAYGAPTDTTVPASETAYESSYADDGWGQP
jgi:hypothetical protein